MAEIFTFSLQVTVVGVLPYASVRIRFLFGYELHCSLPSIPSLLLLFRFT